MVSSYYEALTFRLHDPLFASKGDQTVKPNDLCYFLIESIIIKI